MKKKLIAKLLNCFIACKSCRGFTLIEILVVIAIIGILAAVIMQNFFGVRIRSRDTTRKSDLSLIRSALEIYRADLGIYPASLPGCGSALTGGTPSNTYLSKVPCDPINTGQYIYSYVSPAGNATYSLIACLENTKDSQKDSSNNNLCTGGNTNWSYTVINP